MFLVGYDTTKRARKVPVYGGPVATQMLSMVCMGTQVGLEKASPSSPEATYPRMQSKWVVETTSKVDHFIAGVTCSAITLGWTNCMEAIQHYRSRVVSHHSSHQIEQERSLVAVRTHTNILSGHSEYRKRLLCI